MLLRSSSFLGLGLLSALVLAPAVASAHMRVIDPPPRSNADNLKTGGPCGGIPNAGAKKTYFGDMAASPAGGQIKVDFQETVAHRGCYQAWLSTSGQDGQQNQFTKLDQWNDPAGSQANQTRMVNLPAGTKCDRCVLQVIQVMTGDACPENQMPNASAGLSYYACSDIKIGGGGGGGDAGPDDGGSSGSSGSSGGEDGGTSSGGASGGTSGGTTSGGTSGGAASPDDEDDDPSGTGERGRSGLGGNEGGCSTGGAPVGTSAVVIVGVGLALGARRRRTR